MDVEFDDDIELESLISEVVTQAQEPRDKRCPTELFISQFRLIFMTTFSI